MKINVNSIPVEGVSLTEAQEASSWDLDSRDISYMGDISLVASFFKEGGTVSVQVKVSSSRQVQCSRCLEEFIQDVKEEFKFYYKVLPDQDYLEIDEDIRQEMILNFPLKPLCKEDCKGICPVCGKNLNNEECSCSSKFVKFNCKEEKNGTA